MSRDGANAAWAGTLVYSGALLTEKYGMSTTATGVAATVIDIRRRRVPNVLTMGIAAAGLDVFRNEPDIDPRYRSLENAFLLPHLGSATHATRERMADMAVDNLLAGLA